jgi:carboxyl-terminal processing protease
LEQHQEAIINEIEREIVSRYYYQKGKIQMGLKNDQEIKDAISILRDQKRYNDLLKNK